MQEAKRKAFIFLFIAFVFALIAGWTFVGYVKTIRAEMGEMSTYYVAKKDIAPRVPLQAEDFEPVEIPARFMPPNLVTDPRSIEGAVTVVSLAKGDALEKNVLKPVTVSTKSPDSRLVRIMATERIQFDSMLEPLDRVDIIVSFREEKKPVTQVFMRDVSVATVYERSLAEAGGQAQENAKELTGISVDVTLEEARRLIEMINYADHIRVLKSNAGNTGNPPMEKQAEKSPAGTTQPGKPSAGYPQKPLRKGD